MAKKKEKAPSFTRPDVPGRLVTGWEANESGVHEGKHVQLQMTDEVLKRVTAEMKVLREEMNKKAAKVAEAKQALAGDVRRHNALVSAIETGTL